MHDIGARARREFLQCRNQSVVIIFCRRVSLQRAQYHFTSIPECTAEGRHVVALHFLLRVGEVEHGHILDVFKIIRYIEGTFGDVGERRRTTVENAACNLAGIHGAGIGKLRVSKVRIVFALVGVFHAHGLLHVETAPLYLHPDGDGMPLQPSELLGQSGVAGRKADSGIAGISHEQEFSATGIIAVVVRHVEYFVVEGDADHIAECESCLLHVCFRQVKHGSVVLVIR